ncbi:DNA primase [Candidatus Nomurabacteria bacterium]|nr:DNA primase [Candidatus Nomurabacteria bacterium]
MNDHVQQIKDRLTIEEIVGEYVSLEGAGKNMRACCPFHNERTPSFYVTPDKGIYKCFGCGKGGDIFSFIQEIEGLEFKEALKLLADRAGVELTYHSEAKEQKSEREHLYKIMDLAMRWYEVQLRKTPAIVDYLTNERGLTKETLVNFHVGYAPAGWQHLTDILKNKGFTDDLIKRAGLAIDGKKGIYDRFRERIMFPIFDGQGRPVAFSGRIYTLPDSQTDTSRIGKYVNSPEGELYDKSRILFGYDRAKQVMKQEDKVYIVEGQIDLLMAHQAGATNAVALSGTALTPYHCKLIKRFTNTVILALDGDDAGLKAAGRSVRIATGEDMKVQVVVMPDGKDPADVIHANKDTWKELIASPRDYIDVRLERIRDEIGDPHARLKALHADVYDLIAGYTNPILRDHYLQRVQSIMNTSIQAVHEDFQAWTTGFIRKIPNRKDQTSEARGALSLLSPKEMLVGYLEGREDNEQKERLIQQVDELFQEYQLDIQYTDVYETFGSLIDELIIRVHMEQPDARSAGVFVRGLGLQIVLGKLYRQERELNTATQLSEVEALRKKIHEVREKMNEV